MRIKAISRKNSGSFEIFQIANVLSDKTVEHSSSVNETENFIQFEKNIRNTYFS